MAPSMADPIQLRNGMQLAPWPPRIIDISCPEDLWTEEAAQVPMLASPSGWGSSLSSALARELQDHSDQGQSSASCASESSEGEATPECVQEHINSVLKGTLCMRRRETQQAVDAAVDRAAERDDLVEWEKQEELEEQREELLDRAGEALRAAAMRRATEEKFVLQELATLPLAAAGGRKGAAAPLSSASGTTGTPSSSLSEVGDYGNDESAVLDEQVQLQIRRATEAARERRAAEAQDFLHAGARIKQAAEDAWKRRQPLETPPWSCAWPNHSSGALPPPPGQLDPVLDTRPLSYQDTMHQHQQQLPPLQRLQQLQEEQDREQRQLQQQQLQRQVQEQLHRQQYQQQQQEQQLHQQQQQQQPWQQLQHQQLHQQQLQQQQQQQQQQQWQQQQQQQQLHYHPQQQPQQYPQFQNQPPPQYYQQPQTYQQQQAYQPYAQQQQQMQQQMHPAAAAPQAGFSLAETHLQQVVPLSTTPQVSQGISAIAPYSDHVQWNGGYMDSKSPDWGHTAPQFGGC